MLGFPPRNLSFVPAAAGSGIAASFPTPILAHILHLICPTFHLSPFTSPHLPPITSIAGRVVYESPTFLVVDKPAHLLIHPTKPDGTVTLWHQLTQLLAFEVANGGQVSVITRLDRETSGLVLVAKTHSTARDLHTLIERQQLTKRYLAIVWGWPDHNDFEVDQPLLRQGTIAPSKIWLKQAVHPSGYPSRTRFRVINCFENPHGKFAQLECEPLTGRTHQIRVHLAFTGYPIVGDKIYGPDENCYLEFIETGWTPALADRLLIDHHALHASSLAFILGSEHFEFNSPMPDHLRGFCLPRTKAEE
jgi:23S rRNA pseudouridine1911/1915/1917 synthase